MELNNFELESIKELIVSRDTLNNIIKHSLKTKQERPLSNREAFDEIIERIAVELDPRSVSILIQLEKILSEETSFFDEVDDDTE